MISITCTSCKRVLSIDDAFAGGVCRCQFCGTIQTVPAKNAAQKAASVSGKGSKTLFENKARSAGVGSGSGLEDLADIVQSSSGLSNADLRKSKSAPLPPPPPPKNLTPILSLAGAIIVILLIVVIVLAMRPSTPAPPTGGQTPTPIANQPQPNPQPAAASFCGIPIDTSVVVYVIDNGASSADVLDAVKLALFKSIDSLGPDRQFKIVFWNSDSPSYPTQGTTFAVKDNVDIARKKLADVTAAGSTDPVAALTAALAENPGQIFVVTAKAGDLDDSLVDKVLNLWNHSKTKINCIAINGVPGDKVLAKIAAQTKGQFLPLPDSGLKAFAF